MKKEFLKNMARTPEYIPGIYNYCDRWCERCPLTARCMNFALSTEQFADAAAQDVRSNVFWQKLAEAFRLTRELLEETLKEQGIVFEEPAPATPHDDLFDQPDAAQHPGAQAAKIYTKMVARWFRSAEAVIRVKIPLEEQQPSALNLPNLDILEDATSLKQVLETVSWYQHQIYVKLVRAFVSQQEERFTEAADPAPRDSDGSAKVALIGIDRSIAAWMALRQYLPERADDIIDLLVHLQHLRQAVDQTFPQAHAFVRPGFDDGGCGR